MVTLSMGGGEGVGGGSIAGGRVSSAAKRKKNGMRVRRHFR